MRTLRKYVSSRRIKPQGCTLQICTVRLCDTIAQSGIQVKKIEIAYRGSFMFTFSKEICDAFATAFLVEVYKFNDFLIRYIDEYIVVLTQKNLIVKRYIGYTA